MRTFFTSDTHFWHPNMVAGISTWESGYRNFSMVEEMDRHLLECINVTVGPDDVLYHLGDFTFGNIERLEHYRSQIQCKTVHLLFGNHDIRIRKHTTVLERLFASYGDYREIKLAGKHIVLCHYPLASWNRSGKGAWHLHGHCHGNLAENRIFRLKRMDVGVDTNDFKPYSFEDIKRHMEGNV